ncbi:MAG: hypothetical protein AAGC85_00620 [Bacteroidota bacterium]
MMHTILHLAIMRVYLASKSVKRLSLTSNSLQKKLLTLEYESADSRR